MCNIQIFHISLFHKKHNSFASSGLQPVGDSWSTDCIVALQREVSNRILRIEIQGAHEEKALVALIDEGSDPQINVAELLISAGFGTPASALGGSGDHQLEEKADVSTKTQGEDFLEFKILPESRKFCRKIFKGAHPHADSEAEVKADVKGSDFSQEQVQAESQAEGLQLAPLETAAAASKLQPDCVWPCGETQ